MPNCTIENCNYEGEWIITWTSGASIIGFCTMHVIHYLTDGTHGILDVKSINQPIISDRECDFLDCKHPVMFRLEVNDPSWKNERYLCINHTAEYLAINYDIINKMEPYRAS